MASYSRFRSCRCHVGLTRMMKRRNKSECCVLASGANGLAYVPTADDAHCQLGAACLPCAGSQPLGQTHFCVTPAVLIDPEMSKIVRSVPAMRYM
jgi:hypothetical protein